MIARRGLFGSVLREDFRDDNGVDFLGTFAPESHWPLFDLVPLEEERAGIVGRKVDRVSRWGLAHGRNPLHRKIILDSMVFYGWFSLVLDGGWAGIRTRDPQLVRHEMEQH